MTQALSHTVFKISQQMKSKYIEPLIEGIPSNFAVKLTILKTKEFHYFAVKMRNPTAIVLSQHALASVTDRRQTTSLQ